MFLRSFLPEFDEKGPVRSVFTDPVLGVGVLQERHDSGTTAIQVWITADGQLSPQSRLSIPASLGAAGSGRLSFFDRLKVAPGWKILI